MKRNTKYEIAYVAVPGNGVKRDGGVSATTRRYVTGVNRDGRRTGKRS